MTGHLENSKAQTTAEIKTLGLFGRKPFFYVAWVCVCDDLPKI